MKLKINTAFLLKAVRELSREEQVVFFSHIATVFFCFFPWAYIEPFDYSESPYWVSAFGGHTLAIGGIIFLLSVGVCAIFLDKILDRRKIHLPIAQNYVFLAAGVESLLLLFLTLTVWSFSQDDIGNIQLRFGLFLCILAQIVALVATFLKLQTEKKVSTRHFFRSVEDAGTPTPRAHFVNNADKDSLESKKTLSQTLLLHTDDGSDN